MLATTDETMRRKFLIAGNWKMNKTPADGAELASQVVQSVGKEHGVDVVLCPPFTALESVSGAIEGSAVKIGAQNMHPEASGAYTGEVSAAMLRALFCTHVILGHSERRSHFGEDDSFINKKVLAALKSELKPILCVGETLEERESGKTLDVVKRHVQVGLKGVSTDHAGDVIVAYEPVWAIGTGKVATTGQAQEVHAFIRGLLVEQFGDGAQRIRILYGGSMKPSNAPELLEQPDIDGGLIGGAALEATSFLALIDAAAKAKA